MGVNYNRLVKLFEARPSSAGDEVRQLFEQRELKSQDFDLGKLFAECFGWSNYLACREGRSLASEVMRLSEASGAVSTAAFQNISGQIVYNAVLEPYQSEDFVFTRVIPEVDTNLLDGEKIAGITEIGDEVALRGEGDPYALAGVGEDWVFTPPVRDRGMIVPVTWEAIFNDRTGRLLDRCRDVGKWAAVNREKRAIDCIIDENTTAHRYNWRGTVIATYGDNSGNHTWDNLAASNALVDWTDVDAVEQVLNGITDPYTGEPVMVNPTHLIVTKQLEQTARRILSATEIRVATPGFATSGNPNITNVANPYNNKYELLTSRLLAARLATDTTWFLGAPAEYARYMVAERLNVAMAPPNSHDEFHRRIVQQFRVNERGAYTVIQPRVMATATA